MRRVGEAHALQAAVDEAAPVTRADRPRFSIVCLSSQEWETALPTNRQQIMRRAGAAGHEVVFVETGGFVGRHLWQLARGPHRRRLVRKLAGVQPVAPNVRVAKLWNLLPFAQRYALCNRLNWRLGARWARRAAARLPAPRILWIYDPRGAPSIGSFGEEFSVYDCVDDYPQQVGPSPRRRELVAALDGDTAARSRLVFATTPSLVERQLSRNPRSHLVANVGDFEHFRTAADPASALPELRDLPRPVLGFAGNFLETKVDFDLLAAVAGAFPEATILLAGPARGAAHAKLERLLRSAPNTRWLGLQPYELLPRVVAAFDVGLIPYLENDYTRSCFPLKLYEYLAGGKPVVAAGLPSVGGLAPQVVLAHSKDEFVEAVRDALHLPPSAAEARVALAARNTWDGRAQRLLDLVTAELAS
jgi:glycosyltransferase involved in cell wall biosynthesis